jgi:hypothetical protein
MFIKKSFFPFPKKVANSVFDSPYSTPPNSAGLCVAGNTSLIDDLLRLPGHILLETLHG